MGQARTTLLLGATAAAAAGRRKGRGDGHGRPPAGGASAVCRVVAAAAGRPQQACSLPRMLAGPAGSCNSSAVAAQRGLHVAVATASIHGGKHQRVWQAFGGGLRSAQPGQEGAAAKGFFRQHSNYRIGVSTALHLPSEESTGVEGRRLEDCKEGMQEQGACPPSRLCLRRPDALQHQSSGAHRAGISMLPLAARARPTCSSGCLLAGSRLRSTLSPPMRLSAAGSCSSILATLRALLADFPRNERAVVVERRGLGASASCCRLAARNSWLRPPTDLCRSVKLHVCNCARSRPAEALRSSKPTTRAQGGGDWGNGAALAAAKALANGLISSIEQNWRDCGKGLPE